ncbi:hypothetical protein PROFUN_11050 [Planoprotostelium fungivorum]|uniref:Uncharacterized protein n=1 Tax=Planoprotostelium fungivorum TaxID=1890364 RepID=A0A2P6NBQ1_9EUKA|nr:hypothetical protein PROFUN_11050 [Planoprotostelium fungivorum]
MSVSLRRVHNDVMTVGKLSRDYDQMCAHELFAIMSSSDRHYKCVKLVLQDKRMDPLCLYQRCWTVTTTYLDSFAWHRVSLCEGREVVFHTSWFNRHAQPKSCLSYQTRGSLLGLFNMWNTR